MIIGGDLNTDFRRIGYFNTTALNTCMVKEHVQNGLQHVTSNVDYTFQSKINNIRSITDHFLLTDNLFNTVCEYNVLHEGDNLSDHSVISMPLQITVQYLT